MQSAHFGYKRNIPRQIEAYRSIAWSLRETNFTHNIRFERSVINAPSCSAVKENHTRRPAKSAGASVKIDVSPFGKDTRYNIESGYKDRGIDQ